ncbi:ctr-9 [Symbiodinium natans]|uniref:Ctr-9 protein n=1 Tax=Symbiodinium natans TaxID=878477 RepID=A0A812P2E2_9DINO|nr:ctr-9 [Symbiodinium natans]
MAAGLIARAARASSIDAEVEACLQNATSLLDEARSMPGSLPANPEFVILEGFQCLVRHVLAQRPEVGRHLQRAEILFDAALKLKKSSPRALMGKACVRASRRDWKQALDYFRRVLQRAAPHAPQSGEHLQVLKELRFALATCFAGLGRYQQAKNALLGVVAADAKDVEALCALAYLESKPDQGNEGRQRAATHMAEAMQADPAHPAVLCRAADHAFACGLEEAGPGEAPDSWRLAEDLLRRALKISDLPQVVAEVNYQLGRLEHAQGRFAEARDLYKKCVQTNPDHLVGVYNFAQCLVHERSFSNAVTVLEQAPQQLRQEPEVLKLLTAAYLATGEHDKQASKISDDLVEARPDDIEAWAMRAEAYSRLEKMLTPKETIESYEQMARLMKDPEAWAKVTPQMWNNLGTVRAMHGDPAQAKEAYDHGMERVEEMQQLGDASGQSEKDLRVAEITMRFNKAWLAENQAQEGDMLQAIGEYLALTEEVKWFADALLQLGGQWQRLGRTEEALRNFQEAMKNSPFLGKLLCSEALRAAGKYEEALKWGERAAKQAQSNEHYYACVFVGNLFYEASANHKTGPTMSDDYLKKAMEYFVKALEVKKDCQFAANGLGMVFAKRGKMDLAKQTFQSVVQHKAMDENPSAYINLAHVYLESTGKDADIRTGPLVGTSSFVKLH